MEDSVAKSSYNYEKNEEWLRHENTSASSDWLQCNVILLLKMSVF